MNTLEVNYKHKINNFADFVKYAKKQFVEYEKLEGRNWKEYDFSIDCAEDQMIFKDMLQIRCIEELTEASIAFNEGYDHFIEEITDALNFFISACVMCDKLDKMPIPEINHKDRTKYIYNKSSKEEVQLIFYVVIEKIGYLCNLLKNRPWAQSNYLVSMLDFQERFEDLWFTFWDMLDLLGFSKEKVFECFERKYEVNLWRIKTGY